MHLPRVQKAAGDWAGVRRDFWAGDTENTVLRVAQVWQSAHDDLHPMRGHSGEKAAQEEPLPVGEAEEKAQYYQSHKLGSGGDLQGRFRGPKCQVKDCQGEGDGPPRRVSQEEESASQAGEA